MQQIGHFERRVSWRARAGEPEKEVKSDLSLIGVSENRVVVRTDLPVLAGVVLLWVVLFVVGKEGVERDTLLEVLDSLGAPDVLKELKVSEHVHASVQQSVPVHALKLQVCIVLLEGEVQSLVEVDVRSLDRVHVLSVHHELPVVEVLWENFHL